MDTENTGATKKAAARNTSKPTKRRKPAKATKPTRRPASQKASRGHPVKEDQPDYQRSEKTHYWVRIFNEWCKACGICAALCPQDIIVFDKQGYPRAEDMDECTGCRNCEIHCPDFAITIKKRHPERRKSDGNR